jgi:twitching motility protein PilT
VLPLNEIFQAVVDAEASDLHLTAGSPPLMRVHGTLAPAGGDSPLTPMDTEAALAEMLRDADKLASFVAEQEVDFSYALEALGRFRVNAFRQRGSVALVCRRIPEKVPVIGELGLPEAVARSAEESRGLVLVSGATGSGKSTTLAAILNEINRSSAKHIVTIEDPIEFVYRNDRAVINQREVGSDTASFARALKRVLRQDPDVIAIGEMRDEETVESACYAARTGHLVLSTVHANDALETIQRIIDLFPQGQAQNVRTMLASTLKAIVVQRLVPTASGDGRVAASEVLVSSARVRDMIADPALLDELPSAIAEGAYYGMQTFDQSLLALHASGRIAREDAITAATHPHDLKLQLDAEPVASTAA